jgi:hypothetical protein
MKIFVHSLKLVIKLFVGTTDGVKVVLFLTTGFVDDQLTYVDGYTGD